MDAAPAAGAGPCVLVIFGATGDLTKRLLVPALYNLRRADLLPDEFAMVGVGAQRQGRRELPPRARRRAFASSRSRRVARQRLAMALASASPTCSGDFDDPGDLRAARRQLGQDRGRTRHRRQLPVLSRDAAAAFLRRSSSGSAKPGCCARRTGTGGGSSSRSRSAPICARRRRSTASCSPCSHESQIYRIDHYLGKETVQNIMVLRFANGIFEPLWNRNHIDHVQITVAETRRRRAPRQVLRRDRRAARHGAEPSVPAARAHRDGAAELASMPTRCAPRRPRCWMRSTASAPEDALRNVVRGQYGAGTVNGQGRSMPTASAPNVAPGSTTETYVAMQLMIDNWRWAGVPFYLRTGKALPAPQDRDRDPVQAGAARAVPRHAGRAADARMFSSCTSSRTKASTLQFSAKVPGPSVQIDGVEMDVQLPATTSTPRRAPATRRCIYDCMIGDATLFQRADDIEAGWRDRAARARCLGAGSRTTRAGYLSGRKQRAERSRRAALRRDGRRWRALGGSAGGKSS